MIGKKQFFKFFLLYGELIRRYMFLSDSLCILTTDDNFILFCQYGEEFFFQPFYISCY